MSVFFMRRRMIVQKKAICDNISSEKFAKIGNLIANFYICTSKKK